MPEWKRQHTNSLVGSVLMLYLFAAGIGAAALVIANFPTQTAEGLIFPGQASNGQFTFWPLNAITPEQGLLFLAFLAGSAGSFLHGAQSLSSYLGNETFKPSWTVWYLVRPWIGGVLGMVIYWVLRAGLMGGGPDVNPYGVAALGALGGWFSKTTTDKLQEVFETLFKTDADKNRTDKLNPNTPIIDRIEPNPVPSGQNTLVVRGRNFQDGAVLVVGGQDVSTAFISAEELQVDISSVQRRGATVVRLRNPSGESPLSEGTTVEIRP